MGDEYFTKLYNLRTEDAKVQRGVGNPEDLKPIASNGGCESVSNDTRNIASNATVA
jgi:hypothetical protein